MRSTWLLLFLLLAVACGDDAPGSDGGVAGDGAGDGDGDGDGEGDGDGDGDGDGEGDGDGDGEGSCDGPNGRQVLAPTDTLIAQLDVAADDVIFVSRDPSLLGPSSIEAIGHDGEDRRVLFTSTGQRRITSILVHGEDVLFLEENEELVARLELSRVPIAGGDAERIGEETIGNGYLIGADDSYAYFASTMDQPVGALYRRIDLDSGEITIIGTLEAVGTPLQVSLSGDSIFFYAGYAGTRAGEPAEIYGLPKDSEEATPDSLWAVDGSDPCGFPLGGLFATPTKLACGFSGVAVRERDGSGEEVLIEPDIVNEQNVLVATSGEDLYLIERARGDSGKVRMKRMPTSGGTPEPIVCDLGTVANRVRFGFFPDQTAYEVVVGESDVFWMESTFDDSTPRVEIRAAAK